MGINFYLPSFQPTSAVFCASACIDTHFCYARGVDFAEDVAGMAEGIGTKGYFIIPISQDKRYMEHQALTMPLFTSIFS